MESFTNCRSGIGEDKTSQSERVEMIWETDVKLSLAVLAGVLTSIFVLGSAPIGRFGWYSFLQRPDHLIFQCLSSPMPPTSRWPDKLPAVNSTMRPTSSSSIPTSRLGKLSKQSSWSKRTYELHVKSSMVRETFSRGKVRLCCKDRQRHDLLRCRLQQDPALHQRQRRTLKVAL